MMAPPSGTAASMSTVNPLASISLASDLLPHLPGETQRREHVNLVAGGNVFCQSKLHLTFLKLRKTVKSPFEKTMASFWKDGLLAAGPLFESCLAPSGTINV